MQNDITKAGQLKNLWEGHLCATGAVCGGVPGLVRGHRPLVHLLTNYVTVTDCVNAVLASGGRAICSHGLDEAAEVCRGADALVCNLGATEYYDAMDLAAKEALINGIPLVVDPVGCSASAYRRDKCLQMMEAYHPKAVRGNYAEIASLIEGHSEGGGLDSTLSVTAEGLDELKEGMEQLALKHGLILIASGPVDICTDGRRTCEISRGTKTLRRITGAGCLSTAVLAAFLAVSPYLETRDAFDAACAALNFVALSGEAAEEACRITGTGVGHFHMFFMDALGSAEPI